MSKLKRPWWWFGGGATVVGIGLIAASAVPGASGDAAGEVAPPTHMASSALGQAQEVPLVTLYKNPTCACCSDWAEHMRENGFRVEVEEGVSLAAVKQRHGVPRSLASCHTALVDGYALEGHVPADAVRRLLAERPDVTGLAVPGMPAGVPGMPGEGLAPYDVLAFEADGATRVYLTK